MKRSERWRDSLNTVQLHEMTEIERVLEDGAKQLRDGVSRLSAACGDHPMCQAVCVVFTMLAQKLERELDSVCEHGVSREYSSDGRPTCAECPTPARVVEGGIGGLVGGLVDAVSGFMQEVGPRPPARARETPTHRGWGAEPRDGVSLAVLANDAAKSVILKQGAGGDGSYFGAQASTHIRLLWDSLEVVLTETEGLRTMGSHGALVGLLEKVVQNLKRVRSEGQ